MQEIRSKLEAARKELLDLGLRNPLLHYRPSATKGLQVVRERSASVYQFLVTEGKTMFFKPKPPIEDGITAAAMAQLEEGDADWNDNKLRTPETEEGLQHKLLHTYYAARIALEEQGVNTLYLALGMLQWYESGSTEPRLAPLVLVPVTLERSSARERFRLRYTGGEVGGNLSLAAKMKADFSLSLPLLPEGEEAEPEAYFEKMATAITHYPHWKVVPDAIVLGFFSFGKFLLYNDLDPAGWPEDRQPHDHPLLQRLLHTGFEEAPPAAEDPFLDDRPEAARLLQVVDADSSQLEVLLAVDKGRHLVVQGPPGTGKSQTITNIIAHAIGQGKKVLFVAEKMAALEVVKRRLDSANLGEACLELHSHKAHKKELHEELRRVMDLGKPAIFQLQQEVALLQQHRDELNAYARAVNDAIGQTGLSPQQLFGYLLQLQPLVEHHPVPRISMDRPESWDRDRIRRAELIAGRMEALLQETGVPAEALFWGCRLKVVSPLVQDTLDHQLELALAATVALRTETGFIAGTMGLPVPANREESIRLASWVQLAAAKPDLRDLSLHSDLWLRHETGLAELLASGKRLAEIYAAYDGIFLPEAWEEDVLPLRQELLAHGEQWYRFVVGSYGKSLKRLRALTVGELPAELPGRLQYVDDLLEARRLRTFIPEYEPVAANLFGSQWQGAKSDWAALEAATHYLLKLHRMVQAGACPSTLIDYLARQEASQIAKGYHEALLESLNDHGKSVDALAVKLELDEALRFGSKSLSHQPFALQLELLMQWRSGLPALHRTVSWNNLAALALEEGFEGLVTAATGWAGAKSLLKTAFQKTLYENLLQEALVHRPPLRLFERATHEEVVRHFRRLDLVSFQYNRALAALKHWEGMPAVDAGGQATILRTEFNKKARHLPIRRLMQEAGLAIQAIKPVFMMSPLSIAQFLPPGALEFDLVLFDEASQVRPVEALGALLRGKQLVVVGDTQQLPPTSFFEKLYADAPEEESLTADIPSILGLCTARGVPQQMLRWHYRSRHESLIHLSNEAFYNNRLVVFPSPGSAVPMGLAFHHLKDAAYDRGGSRTNALEATAVAEAVMAHARRHPYLSLGVVAFSSAQREAIQEALEGRRRWETDAEGFFARHTHEPFFIKNLENVQGDERDVILISIGYGRTAEGVLHHSFGPLNLEGGEKRLNVLMTRARLRCEVFSNFTAADLESNRSPSLGVKALRRFLHYAQQGEMSEATETHQRAEGPPFEEAVARKLAALGYTVHRQVGSKGYCLDLAVVHPEHPGRYVLGIECDGASYGAARSARDRDRLRQQVLEGMGWQLHRIWSADWFRQPDKEALRVVDAIKAACALAQSESVLEASVQEKALLREPAGGPEKGQPLYRVAVLPEELAGQQLHQQPMSRVASMVETVVQAESPVHVEEVARRLAEGAGLVRVSPRMRDHIRLAAKFAQGSGRVEQRGDFLWHAALPVPVVRNRSGLPSPSRRLKYIAPEELTLAIQKVVRESVAISAEAAVPYIARLFGFSRVTEDMRTELLEAVQERIEGGQVRQDGDLLKAWR
ncbi:DUF3320 domain-containing protein [Paraflavisolibacter sp. H34]|uniref:DUF3320 domain-containing protein n=1 Tax=Huijunlia imazamoxiresistens TaxID=3127457 RepID=UPI0030183CB8